jgi:hypothetical protein
MPRMSFDPTRRDRVGAQRDQYGRIIQYDANGEIVPYGTDGKPIRATVGSTRPAQPQNNIGANPKAFADAFRYAPQTGTNGPAPGKIGGVTPVATPIPAPKPAVSAPAAVGLMQGGPAATMAGAVTAATNVPKAAPQPAPAAPPDAFRGPQTRTAPTGHGIESFQPSQSGGRWVGTTGTAPVRLPVAESHVINPGVTGWNSSGQRMHDTPGGGALEYDPRHDAQISQLRPGDGAGPHTDPFLPPGASGGFIIPKQYQTPGASPIASVAHGFDNSARDARFMPPPPAPPTPPTGAGPMGATMAGVGAAVDAFRPHPVTANAAVGGSIEGDPNRVAGLHPEMHTTPPAAPAPQMAAPVATPSAPSALPVPAHPGRTDGGLDLAAFDTSAVRELGNSMLSAIPASRNTPGGGGPRDPMNRAANDPYAPPSQPQARPTPQARVLRSRT